MLASQIPEAEQERYEKGQHLRGRDAELAEQVLAEMVCSLVIHAHSSKQILICCMFYTLSVHLCQSYDWYTLSICLCQSNEGWLLLHMQHAMQLLKWIVSHSYNMVHAMAGGDEHVHAFDCSAAPLPIPRRIDMRRWLHMRLI